MRYGIFSDVHANLEAMESVVNSLRREKIDNYFCVGDVVGYGANPHECIEAVKSLGATSIAGNHDWAVIGRVDTRYFNPMAKEAIHWTKRYALREDMIFLDNLKLIYKNDDFILVHGTLQEADYFHYLIDDRQAQETFELMDRDVCFVGHSHVPGIFTKKENRIQYSSMSEIYLEDGCQYIINVGSVGQPRDGNPMAAYCVYDTEAKTIFIKRINYIVEEAQRKIMKAGLPAFLASRLAVGR